MTIEQILKLENNDSITGTFVITDISLKAFKEKEGKFLAFFLQDKTGRVPGKIWEDTQLFLDKLEDDMVITIKGKTNIFGGKMQVVVSDCKIVTEYDISDFIQTSLQNPEDMFQKLQQSMDSIKSNSYLKIWEAYKSDKTFIELFKRCPGGKGDVHHAYIHGLLEHVSSMVMNAESLARIYPTINLDILKIGCFLHDIGKIYSYDFKVSIKMTDLGRLHGHPVLGYHDFVKRITETIVDVGERTEATKIIGHMILSHHGGPENQSPISPMTIEGVALAYLDSIDSDMNHITKMLNETSDVWTQFDHLRGRFFYLSAKKKVEEEKSEEKKEKKIKKKQGLYTYEEK